ncbi:retention module-containing protein [Aeromonas encheleia]|uniref:Retention module-containing protein n=1 Tax=Aeromonas encheleia TaxID=73010 RepID=A0AAE9MKZ0_9GAMM|nr:retention module-containing protein [Aeromonas encheleia]USV59218.1 retention module-containing protein [Aeromonas encheleia]
MAELRIEKPTLITQLEGTVLVMDADGSTRRATLGMQLQPGERLLAESDGRFELADPAGETHELAQPDPVPGAQTAAVDPELASLQEAIRQGADPTAVFEETAAGNAAAATGGGVVGSSAGGFVVVDRANDATLAEAGFDTDHQRLPQGNDDPYVEDQDQVAEITITEPQTLDNIINADEATGVIIRGTVEDVEVGQTVTVTLIDQDGNRLTTTTVVLPGFVWEADFGDVTGKLVDGPLSIQADTQDAAGNRASDLGQTLLDTITTITLDLSDESDTGASQVDDLTRDTTPLLQGKGEPGATVTLSLEGKVLTVLTVDGNGNWQYQIPSDMADGAYDFRVDSVDIAGNRASDILTVTVDTRAGIDIDDLDTQNILGHDNVTLSGSTTQVEAGQSVTITLIGQNGQTLYRGAALVGSDGRWQLNGLDLSSLSGPYEVRAEVTDLAGNRVIDGAPLIGQSDTLTLSEADLADGPVSATGSLHTGAGMDGNLQVGFAADQGALQNLGLTSQGSALSYQLSGQTLTATAGGATVFTLTLANDGSYRIVWNQSLDHGQDSLSLPFSLEYRDSDGDLVNANLDIKLVDSTPPDFTLTPITLTEDAFADQGAVVGQSQFVVGHQADPLLADSVAFADQAGTLARLNGSDLRSDGHALSFEFSGDRLLTGYYLDDNGNRVEVLKAELSASQSGSDIEGKVTVSLTGPLDHQGSDQLSLGLSVCAKEIDGDETRADLVVTIDDGIDPSLGLDAGISLQEGASGQTLDGQLPVHVGSDRLVSLNFEASQPGLDDLTSGGKPTTYQVNGNQITLLDAGGKTILTVTLDLDGKYHVQLNGVLDQPVNTDSVNLGLQVQGTDFDGDRSNLGTLNIAITDGALPSVDAVSLNLVEDGDWSAGQTLSGDLNISAGTDPLANISFDDSQPGLQGLTSGGAPVLISVSGNSISGSVNGQNVFTLTLDQQGHYVFTLNQPLDQGSADSRLLAGFTLTDSDGDKVSSSLSVSVGDGANPVISAVTGTSLTEADQGDGAVVGNMSFTVSHGSDALAPDSLKFDLGAIQQSLDGKFSSHGSPITFSLDADGSLVGTSADGREVLRAELSLVDNNGNWSVTAKVTLSGELDHQGNESLDLPLNVTLTDKDGDSASTTLPLVIKDGNAPGFVAGSGVSLDEGNLDGSNALTGTGHFSVNAGSDRVSEVSFAEVAEQPALTALGQQVKYELVDGDPSIPGNQILKGYVEVNGQRIEVLQVEISGKLDNAASNDFDYKVTLFEGVHQANGSSTTELPFKLNIVDSDKGAGNNDSTTGTLNVSIGEGNKPVITLTGVTLNEGRFDGAASGVTGDDEHATGTLTITADSDPVVDVRLTLSGQVMDAGGQPITHNGETLTWQEVPGSNGHSFQGVTASGTLVLTVTLPSVPGRIEAHSSATLDYEVTVHTNLDHGASDNLSLTLPLQVTDSDGTLINGDTTVVITDAADPSLGLDAGISLQEGGPSQSLDGQLPVHVGSDRLVSLNFEASQPGLDDLTSGGKPTTYQVNGNQITLLDAGGKTVLTVTLDLDGKYHLTLDGVLDQPVNTNSVNLGLQVQGTDFDGDQSNLGTLNIAITDGALPGVDAVSLNLVEDSDWSAGQTLSGDLNISAGTDPLANISFDASQPGLQGLTSGGAPVLISVSGNSISGSVNGQNVFTLTLDQQGHYVFTLNQPLDQGSADSRLLAGFTLTDSDGDKVSSSLSVSVGDGANPVISAVTGTSLTEADQGDGAVVGNMSFTVSHGSDALAPDSLRFDLGAIQQSLDGKFSSHGSPITFSLDADGSLVGTSADGREVLRAELSLVDNNGNWSVTAKVTLSGELDHQGNESLDLPLNVTLTDKDGDSASTTLPLVIKDGNAPGFVAGSGVSLDEGNLDGSNALTGTGHFSVNAGSDRVSEVSFAEVAEQPALTALGQQVKYELVDGDPSIPGNQILKGYVEVNGQRIEVLEVEISGDLKGAASNDFDYKVTLFEGVHQANGSSTTELPFKLNIVDSDKGAGNNDSTTGTLNVSIGEGDKPVISLTGVNLSEGRFDGAASGVTADDQHATGTLTITADSDPVVDVRLTLSGQVVDAGGQPITHNGETLTWQEVPGNNGHSFQGLTASGTLVLTVTLPSVPGRIEAHSSATLDYDITVHTNLDHGASDNLELTLPLQVTDSDGTLINGDTTVVITDAADPLISAIESARVEEADLDASGSQHPGTTPAENGEAAGGKVTIGAGSDRIASLELDVAAFNQANHLTSEGKEVTLAAHSPGWYLASAEGGKPVFWVHLDVNGNYSFHLVGQLDHGSQGKDELGIELPLFVTDFDGDRSPNVTVEVTVQDDMPIGTELAHNLSEAGSVVSGDLLPPANEGADGARVASVTVNGQVHDINGSLTLEVMSPDGKQVMGSLTIGQDGNYSFTPRPGFDHDDASLSQRITAQIVDGDGDTAKSTLTLNLQDEAVRFTVNGATGQEDQGAQDPSQGIAIHMNLDIGDFDRGEHVDQLLIQAPANAHGTFYYNGVALTTTADGKWFIVPPEAMVTTDKVNYSTSGLSFVPADDWSSWSNNKQPLHFQVQVQVGVTEGTPPPAVNGDLAITVQGIADKPVWVSGSTDQHYSINEDGNGIALNVKAELTDTDGSETLSYQIHWESGHGSLTLNGQVLQPGSNGLYTVKAGDINKITVVPDKDYSGDIKLTVTPVSTEKAPVVSGQDKALGDPIELVINVNPQADDAKLSIRDIQGKEDSQLDLGSKISLAHLGDLSDGSEKLFVRIEGLPAGATLLLGGVVVSQDAKGYYEVPYDRIGELKLQPPKNSNVDFDLTIKGVVKDSATLTDANGQTHIVVSEKETGSQSLHVDLIGVVDQPHFDLGTTGWTAEGNGYTTTIQEDGRAPLDFRLESGEKTDTPLDNSESLNLVLEGLPEGAKVFDGNGNELTLTFAGLDAQGKPTYQVDVSDLGNLQIQPPANSTADIHLIAHVVVTENDGDSKGFDVPLTIKVEPEIDAGDYDKSSHGLEDQFVVLDWHPDLTDGAEQVTHLSLSGIEPGYEIWVTDAKGTHQLNLNGGAVDLSDADLQSLLNGGKLLVKAPQDSDKDTNIQSHVTVTQHDVDSSVVVDKVIDGQLHLDIQAVVEPDGNLVQTGGTLESPDGHDIPLGGVFEFQDLDPSSVETIDYLVISDLPPGFVVVGGISDGKGNWTVPNGALGSYALHAPNGFTGKVEFKVSALVHDLSDDGDVSASVRKDLNASADFGPVTTPDQKAADIDFDNSAPITGVEDHGVNFGSQLKSMVTLGSADGGDDELSIVITGLPQGVSVQGLTFDFANGEYLIKLPGGLDDLDKLTLSLPEDYAGNDLDFNVRLVNTDTVSGDTKVVEKEVSLSITPEVDINGGKDGLPELQLQIKDMDHDGQPDNLEDTEIHLDLSVKLADISPSVADGGLETVESVTLTVDAKYGHFLDGNGQPTNSLVVKDPAALKDLVFVPREHFSGQVPLDIKVDILDTATTGEDRGSWSGQVGFEVNPVNDPANVSVHDVNGNEDGRVSLAGFGASLIDNDGSEQIVALQIKGVPDGFTLSAPAVNNGGGVWQVPVGTDFAKLSLIPPANFSGSLDLGLSVFTLDKGLTVPLETSGNFTVTVNPVGDAIIADMQDKASGTEGDVITLNLGLETRDTQATGGSAGNVHENGPEQVRVTLEGVPDGAEIRLPSGVDGSVVDLGGGRWQITTDGGKLDAIELVTKDANGVLDLKVTAQSLDNGALGPEVNGHIQVEVSAVNDAPINLLPSDPQVAQEDKPFTIQGLQVKDVDAGSGNIEVRLSVNHGTLTVLNAAGVAVSGDGSGSLVLNGTLAQINALLNGGIDYKGSANFHGDDALTMTTNDLGNTGSGGALSDSDVLPIEVQPVNDAPVNLLPTEPQIAQEDTPFRIQGLQVNDVDAGGSPIKVTLSVMHGILELPAGSGVTVTGSGSDTLVLSGSQAEINALLAGGVTYQGEQDFNGQDALTMVTDDLGNTGSGGALGDSDVLPIEVQPVNDAPINQVPAAMSVKEDGSLSLSGISVKDVDAGSAPLSMVLRVEHGVLTLLGAAGAVSVQGAGTGEITLVGSLTDLNSLINGNLHYEPAKDFWGQDNLTITTSDQGNSGSGGALTDSTQVGITVTAEADDPQLSLGTHDIHALQGAWVPLNLSASVVNPATGELSVRIQNLGGAQVVDEHGQSVGHADSNGDWLLPMDQSVPIYLKDLPMGDHALTLSAESSAGGSTLSSTPDTVTVHSQSGHDLLGSDQNDWLFGSSGDDRILGGLGDDVLRGGHGNDILTGGAGSDLFVWGSGDEGTTGQPAIDTITDFHPEEGDKIDLADLLQGVTDNSVDGLLNHLSASVATGSGGLSDVSLSVSPAGDGQVTQQITLKDVDLNSWNLSGSSSHDILQSMLDNHSLIIQHP